MYALPNIQFLMQKTETPHFGFVDLYLAGTVTSLSVVTLNHKRC